jgi:glycosyltransferase involved in cell wall biosynthesis
MPSHQDSAHLIIAVIPVFNHGSTAGGVAAALVRQGLSVLLVDDGSNAMTAAQLDALASNTADTPWIRVLRHPVNQGKGAAVSTGLREAARMGATHVLQVDADGQHDLAALPAFLAASRMQPDAFILGFPRYDKSVPAARRYGRYLTDLWIAINTLSFTIRDALCGFRLYPLAAVCPLLPAVARATRMDFDPEIAVRLVWAGAPCINLPVIVRYPPDGLSHFRVLHDNARISSMHARLFAGMAWRLPWLLARRIKARWQGLAKKGRSK